MTRRDDHKRAVRDFAKRNGMKYQAAQRVFRNHGGGGGKGPPEPPNPPGPPPPPSEPPKWPSPEHILLVAQTNPYEGFGAGMAAIQRLSAIAANALGLIELNRGGASLFQRMPELLPWLSPEACLAYFDLVALHRDEGVMKNDPRYHDAAIGAACVVRELMNIKSASPPVTQFEDAPQALDSVTLQVDSSHDAVIVYLAAFPTKPWRDRAATTANVPFAGATAELRAHDGRAAAVMVVHHALVENAEKALRSWVVILGEHAKQTRMMWGDVFGPRSFR